MKTLLLLLTLIIALPCEAQLVLGKRRPEQAAAAASPTYLRKQDFEGTGYDNGETWVENASPNEDYTTSPAPLVGSESWQTAAIGGEAYSNFTANDEVWAYAVGNIQTLANNRIIFAIRNSSDSGLVNIKCNADGSLAMVNFATTVTTSAGLISNGTTFHIWMRYKKGTGSNSESDLYVSSNDTKPGSPQATTAVAGSTTQASRVAVMGWNDGNFIWDKVRVDDVNIGSAPE